MISGRADCSDDWLPARIRPVRGESFDSLCRRLAAANGITLTGLLRGCMSKHRGAHTSMEAVAHCIGVEPVALERLTVAEVRRRWGRRLVTTAWLCRQCSARGIEDALRSRYIQFLCLRCGSFLSRADDGTSDVIMASDADLALQDELLDACSSSYPNIDRVDRVVRMAVGIGHSLGGAAPQLMRHPTLSAVVRAYMRRRRLGVGELGVPEDPVLVAAILRLAWDISASEQVQYLAMCALGYRFPLPEREPPHFHRIAPTALRTFMPVGSATVDEVVSAGVRIRELMQIHGLRSTHVPCEVRFASDARIIDTAQYRWRLYACLQLRHWLRCLEVTARPSPSKRRPRRRRRFP